MNRAGSGRGSLRTRPASASLAGERTLHRSRRPQGRHRPAHARRLEPDRPEAAEILGVVRGNLPGALAALRCEAAGLVAGLDQGTAVLPEPSGLHRVRDSILQVVHRPHVDGVREVAVHPLDLVQLLVPQRDLLGTEVGVAGADEQLPSAYRSLCYESPTLRASPAAGIKNAATSSMTCDRGPGSVAT